jgi:hypothetical protein
MGGILNYRLLEVMKGSRKIIKNFSRKGRSSTLPLCNHLTMCGLLIFTGGGQ